MKYRRILQAFARTPFALMPEKAEQIIAFLELKSAGIDFSPEEVARRIGREPGAIVRSPDLVMVDVETGLQAAYPSDHDGERQAQKPDRATAKATGTVALINVYGVINQRASGDLSSVRASTEGIAKSLRLSLADQSVKAVVLNIDSPGGGVYGVAELADEIFRARGAKPIVAQANSLAASAAYWIACAADEIVVTPSGEVGSIGVYGVHQDWSKAYEEAGVAFTLIKAGKFKAEGVDFAPLGDEASAYMQKRVDDYFGMFVRAVARGRGVSEKEVCEGFGEGRVVGAADAVRMKMADRVGTLDDTLSRLGVKSAPATTARAIAQVDEASPQIETPAVPAQAEEPAPMPVVVDPDHQRRAHRNRLRQLGAVV